MRKSLFYTFILMSTLSCNKDSQNSGLLSFGKTKSFTCDDPDLIRIVEEKTGPLENIITLSKDDELKTCECEAFAPKLQHKTGYSNSPWRKYNYSLNGSKINFTAQLKDDGQIVFNGEY